jgi:hypothetical protein
MSTRAIEEALEEMDAHWALRHSPKLPRISEARACFCVGPKNGAPLCPCRMRNVTVVDGRYIETIDHGPVKRL